MEQATNNNDLLQLTPVQQSAIELLLAGRNDRQTSETVDVHRTTITRWRLHHPAFRAELNRQRIELFGAATDRLRSLVPAAVDAIERELIEGANPYAAAVQVLKVAGIDKLDAPTGPIEADVLLDSEVRFARQRDSDESLDAVMLSLGGDSSHITRETVAEDIRKRLSD